MKISFNNINLVGGHEHCESPRKLKITGKKLLQITNLIRAETALIADRRNTQTHISFSVEHQHTTNAAATAFVFKHLSEIAKESSGELVIELEDSQNTTWTLENAAIHVCEAHSEGILSVHAYEIIGSRFKGC